MKDEDFMKTAEAADHLNEDFPDIVLLEQCVVLLMLTYLLKEITIVRILHDNTINFQ